MSIRLRYRIHTTPFIIVAICAVMLVAVVTMSRVAQFLGEQVSWLPLATIIVAAAGPVLFFTWYFSCYAEVRRGKLRLRWFWRKQLVSLKRLTYVEVLPRGRGKSLVMYLEDESGAQAWLPLNSWRDEELLMASVLRATVERRVRIEGETSTVERFGGVLRDYRSYESRLAA